MPCRDSGGYVTVDLPDPYTRGNQIKMNSNNQQQNKPTNNQTNQASNLDNIRLSGAARKRLHSLLNNGLSFKEARFQAMNPRSRLQMQTEETLPIVSGRSAPDEQLPNRRSSNPIENKASSSGYWRTGSLWPKPAGNPDQIPTAVTRSIPAASTQFQRPPVQARLGAPVTRVAPLQSRNAHPSVDRPPVYVRGDVSESDEDDDMESLNVAILPGDYPSELWTTEQLEAVQQSIIDLVRRQSEGSIKPGFDGCTFRQGWLSVRCNNVSTVNWLRDMDTRLRPWEGASLKVIPEPDVPIKRIFVGLFPSLESTSIKYALCLIDTQNEGLFIHDWRVLHRAQRGPNMRLSFSIDSHSAEVLRKRGYNLNYGFSRVKFRPKERENKQSIHTR